MMSFCPIWSLMGRSTVRKMHETRKNASVVPGRRQRRNDLIFIAILLLLALLAGMCMLLLPSEGKTVTVTVNGTLYGIYPLATDTVVEIRTGMDGKDRNVLVIREGKAYVETATCPDGICVKHRAISRHGESIACLPHGVVIVVSSQEDDADIII